MKRKHGTNDKPIKWWQLRRKWIALLEAPSKGLEGLIGIMEYYQCQHARNFPVQPPSEEEQNGSEQ